MNEELLHAYRKEPRPEFAERLHDRINRTVIDDGPKPAAAFLARWKPVFAAATAVACLAVALTVPSVRAVAQDFLDLFRVKKFAAVSISADRMGQLRDGKVDLQTLLGDAVDEIKRPGEPREVASAELAASETGMTVLVPTYVYNLNDAPIIRVMDSASMRVRADAERLRGILDLLGIEDATIPAGLDGAIVGVRIPEAVSMEYRREGKTWVATLTQAPSPEVDLPKDVDIAVLGELGLRIAGLSADEARQFSRSIDWRSTLIVPVPASVGSFREVEVRGTMGLLIDIDSERAKAREKTANGAAPRTILMWSEGGMVYSLASRQEPIEVIQMANSMR